VSHRARSPGSRLGGRPRRAARARGAERRQIGFFQRADAGTLFLDEIGETPADVQPLLLRALETGQIQPLGGEPVEVDARLISATDADLEGRIEAGGFRAPLLYRLNGYEIVLPPLRRRRDDVGRLLFHFLRQELRAAGAEHCLAPPPPGGEPWMPAATVARLAAYDWPGNVRELRNAARQIVVAYRAAPHAGVGAQLERLLGSPETPPPPRPRSRKPAEIGEEEMIAALREHRWQVKAAARRLGISRPSLYLLMERSARIRKAADLGAGEIEACRERHGGDLAAAAARRALNELLERTPGQYTGLSLLAQLELTSGDLGRAVELYAELVRRSPGRIQQSNLGLAYFLSRRYEEAAASFAAAHEAAPSNPLIALNLADARLLSGEGAAEALYRRVLELYAADPASLDWQGLSTRAQAEARLGLGRQAVASIRDASRLAPDSPQAAYAAALVFLLVGEEASAVVEAERALDLGLEPRWFDLEWFGALREDRQLAARLTAAAR